MLFFVHDLEACFFVDVSCRVENALRPQGHFLVACLPRESDTFLDQPFANAQSARLPFHVQQPQFYNLV